MTTNLVKVKTATLEGDALRWAVTKCEGVTLSPAIKDSVFQNWWFSPDDGIPWGNTLNPWDSDWSLTGKLILKYKVGVLDCGNDGWAAYLGQKPEVAGQSLGDPRIAICRAVVTHVLGEFAEVPAIFAQPGFPGVDREEA